jgi:hypothetical protein
MAMSTLYNQNDTIEISFPEEKFETYLKDIGLDSGALLTVDLVKKIFIIIISDFKNGKLSVDELSQMAGDLWGKLPEPHRFETDLGNALYKASELSFYTRRAYDEVCAGTLEDFSRSVHNYYEQNKGR